MKVLFIVPYPKEGPSYRFRVLQYLPYLKEKGIIYSLRPFSDTYFYRILYKRGQFIKKSLLLLLFILRRFYDVFSACSYDVTFIHREAGPFPDYIFEWLFRVFTKRVIYDFDDSIFLKKPLKIKKMMAMSCSVIAGNEFLKGYALCYNKRVTVLPTCIDTGIYRPRLGERNGEKVVIGWIGTPFTSIYLDMLKDVYRVLRDKYANVEFRVVGVILPGNGPVLNCREWSLDSEVSELQGFDIGVMPLFDDDWARGKCAFKIIQYMAVGIPTVASSVGMNKEVIEDGRDGFLVKDKQGWIDKLCLLIENKELRLRMGSYARQKAEQMYSVKANKDKFISIIEESRCVEFAE